MSLVSLWSPVSWASPATPFTNTAIKPSRGVWHPLRLLLDSRVVRFADVVQPNCCHPFLLEALLFQWPSKGVVLLGQCLEHETPESNKSVDETLQDTLPALL